MSFQQNGAACYTTLANMAVLQETFPSRVISRRVQAAEDNFPNKIFFGDEAHFTLGGYISKQNCRIWDSENPQVIEERPLHPEKVTVWCAFWTSSKTTIEPTVTINSERYGHMITDFFLTCY